MPAEPTRANGYLVGLDTPLDPPTLNGVFGDIHTRLNEAETAVATFEDALDTLEASALASIQATVAPAIAAAQAALTSLQTQVGLAEDAVQNLINSGLPATGVAFTPASGIAADNVQDAIVEVKSDVEGSVAATVAALPTKGSTIALALALG